ncbi:MAG: hypothetical protein WC455_21935 [Dehalococcoidia bacterium]
MSNLQGALPSTSQDQFSTTTQKTTFEPIRVPRVTVEAFRRSQPKFCQYLEETGQLIIEGLPARVV